MWHSMAQSRMRGPQPHHPGLRPSSRTRRAFARPGAPYPLPGWVEEGRRFLALELVALRHDRLARHDRKAQLQLKKKPSMAASKHRKAIIVDWGPPGVGWVPITPQDQTPQEPQCTDSGLPCFFRVLFF